MKHMIPLPLSIKIVEKKDNWALFEVEGLYPGYGATIGNSLRRVLLSSLEGAAVTKVKIKGVQHEFSTVPGVKEDIINILLNLKQLRFKMFEDDPQQASLTVKGEKEVKGSDFAIPTQLELINKEVHICTLTSKSSEIKIDITVEKGVGYEPIEIRKKERLEIGEIPLDAIYTPVRKMNFKVENMRVKDRTDYDRLKLEMETDGSISPESAMHEASEILIRHFDLIKENVIGETKKVKPEGKKEKEAKKGSEKKTEAKEDITKTKIEDLKLSTRTQNALSKNNIKTLGNILKKSEQDILELEGMGEGGVKEIKKIVKKLGLELKE